MKSSTDLTAKRARTKSVTIDGKQLFKAIGKATVSFAAGNPAGIAAEIPEVLASLGLSDSTETRAWTLVLRATYRSLASILSDYFRQTGDATSQIAALNWQQLENASIAIDLDSRFFERPADSKFCSQLISAVESWLTNNSIPSVDAKNISTRLPHYFAIFLHKEWRSDIGYYELIAHALNSPFLKANQRAQEWIAYNSYLAAQIAEPVFDESFSLAQIYVPARGLVNPRKNNEAKRPEQFDPITAATEEPRAVWLHKEILDWLISRDPTRPVRLLSGGPGSGKSSFAKIISSQLSNDHQMQVLFIPIHQLDTDSPLHAAIANFLSLASHFQESPLLVLDSERTLLLVLDGLDELQMQGRAAAEAAQQFVVDLVRMVDQINGAGPRIFALVTGRDLAVQASEANIKSAGAVVHMLPYFVSAGALEEIKQGKTVIAEDQRDQWWRRYGNLTGQPFNGMPETLKRGEMGEVTAQPLLNYLVSLSYKRGGILLDSSTNLNTVYSDLLDAVHERGWANNPHPTINGIDHSSFIRLLEEVAISVWHGAGRTTTLREVEEHCTRSNISRLLPSFEQGAESGISTLLMAFYFRQKGRRAEGDKTFEFTHKSFGEYLTGLRIVRLISAVSDKLNQHKIDTDDGWNNDEALTRWIEVCGPTAADPYLLEFVRREIAVRGITSATTWQEALGDLLSQAVSRGWPMQHFHKLRFAEQLRWQRNAEETLLCTVNACARVSKKLTRLNLANRAQMGEALKRLQGQRQGPPNILAMSSLSFFDFSDYCFDMSDFYNAHLDNTNFTGAALHFANFSMASLNGADMTGASYLQTNLQGSSLDGARIQLSRLSEILSLDPNYRAIKTKSRGQQAKESTTQVVRNLRSRGALVEELETNRARDTKA